MEKWKAVKWRLILCISAVAVGAKAQSASEVGALIGVKERRASQCHKTALAVMAKVLKVKGICSSQVI
jgi:hypothetical protein